MRFARNIVFRTLILAVLGLLWWARTGGLSDFLATVPPLFWPGLAAVVVFVVVLAVVKPKE